MRGGAPGGGRAGGPGGGPGKGREGGVGLLGSLGGEPGAGACCLVSLSSLVGVESPELSDSESVSVSLLVSSLYRDFRCFLDIFRLCLKLVNLTERREYCKILKLIIKFLNLLYLYSSIQVPSRVLGCAPVLLSPSDIFGDSSLK